MSRGQAVRGLASPFTYGGAYPNWFTIDNPAAGATVTYVVPGEFAVRPVAAHSVLTTDANAANRVPTIDYLDAHGNVYLRNGAGLVVTASTTSQAFEWSTTRAVAEWAANTPIFAPLQPAILYPGFQIRFNVSNIQATDQLSALRLMVECFPTSEDAFPLGVFATDRPK